MRLEVKKYLHDIQRAALLIATFASGKTFDDYTQDDMFRAAVEREFEIIGEAMGRLAKLDDRTASLISEYRRIIAFRNILIHAYDDVKDELVWDIVSTKLPTLLREVDALLGGR